MPVTAPFNPPSADLPGKPFVPAWDVPPVTKEKHDFAQLKSIDLSLLDSDDPAVVDALVQKVKVQHAHVTRSSTCYASGA